MFNLQSGLLRQRFPSRLTPTQAKRAKLQKTSDPAIGISRSLKRIGPGEGKHSKTVSGLVVDGLNRIVISCGLDGKLKVSSASLVLQVSLSDIRASFGTL
jgi:U3 small nucleolar RNA-associated protein 21